MSAQLLTAARKRTFRKVAEGSFPDYHAPLNHTTRHETANSGMAVLIVGPDNRSPEAVGSLHDRNIRNVNPLVSKKDLEMPVLASPICVPQSISVGKSAAGLPSFGFQLLEPFVHFRIDLRVFAFWIARRHGGGHEQQCHHHRSYGVGILQPGSHKSPPAQIQLFERDHAE